MQNTSHAVMAQRSEARDSLDDFPTPPWATRALIEHVLDDKTSLSKMVCLEPACGVGHMAKVLSDPAWALNTSVIMAKIDSPGPRWVIRGNGVTPDLCPFSPSRQTFVTAIGGKADMTSTGRYVG
jgi:hypothetical protein